MNRFDYSECLICIGTYNDGENFVKTLNTIPTDVSPGILVIDDGSTDPVFVKKATGLLPLIRHDYNMGIGKTQRDAIKFANDNGYKVIIFMPGNNKNDVSEFKRLAKPIIVNSADYVQGSRFLKGSKSDHTPLFRRIMVTVLAIMFSMLTFRKITDTMEGFRAIRLSIFDDPDINIYQDWLNRYALETYVYYKVTKGRKYRYMEVPVSKIYPKVKKSFINKKGSEYSKIKPVIDWWDILKPVPYLILGIKK